jgi:hypothetical protein
MNNPVVATGSFSDRVRKFLERVEYRLARSDEDLDAHQRLRYDANLREGVIEPNESRRLTDQFESVANGFNVGVFVEGQLAAALRLHVLSLRHPRSVLRQNYPDEVGPMVEAGAQIIDVTRLAANYDVARKNPHLLYATVRLSMMAGAHFDADYILAGVRTEHIPFYRREFLATQLTPPRPYPTVTKPQCLFRIDYRRDRDAIIRRHPFHDSAPEERRALFGDPARLLPDHDSRDRD